MLGSAYKIGHENTKKEKKGKIGRWITKCREKFKYIEALNFCQFLNMRKTDEIFVGFKF